MIQSSKISFTKVFPVILHSIFFLLFTAILFFFYTRGFIPHDEGWVINPAQRITQGDIPYRDFHYLYLPGVAYVIALGFKVFGISILVSRLVSLVMALTTVLFIFFISRQTSKNIFAYLIPVLLYVSWGPSHLNYAHPTMYTLWGGALTCLLLSLSKKRKLYFFLAGVTAGLTILFKQNFGVALLLTIIVFFFFDKQARKKEFMLYHLLGIMIFPAILLIYFFFTNSLNPFIHDMYFFMISEMIEKGHQATPFIYPDVWYKEIIKTLFYLSPLILSITALYLSYQKNKKILFFAAFAGFYYLIGIRPTTDYVHLVGLLALTGIPLLMIISMAENKYLKLFSYLVFIILFATGIYSALFINYYRWNTPLINQDVASDNPRLGVLTDPNTHLVVSELDDYFAKHSTKNNYMFIDSFAPSFYLITNKRNPTKYIFFTAELLSQNDEEEMIKEIKEKNTPFIFTEEGIKTDTSPLARFIKANYHFDKNANGYYIFKKNK